MKVLHRIRACLIVLLFMLDGCVGAPANPPDPDFKGCGQDKRMICIVHQKSCSALQDDSYLGLHEKDIKQACKRYFILRATTAKTVEIEFRDDTFDKASGVKFLKQDDGVAFDCVANKATLGQKAALDLVLSSTTNTANIGGLYCKFDLTAFDKEKSIQSQLTKHFPSTIRDNKDNAEMALSGSVRSLLFPCDWNQRLFNENEVHTDDKESDDELISLELTDQGKARTCPKDDANKYFLKYKPLNGDWETISHFTCTSGIFAKVSTTLVPLAVDLVSGSSKCVRKKCAGCPACNNCEAAPSTPPGTTAAVNCSEAKPQYAPSDGASCAKITCPNVCKAMRVKFASGDAKGHLHLASALDCNVTKHWANFNSDDNVTVSCLDETLCTDWNPIASECPEETPEGKTCKETPLNNEGDEVCADADTYLTTPKDSKGHTATSQVFDFKCNKKTGRWQGTNVTQVMDNSVVYCLTKTEKVDAQPSTGGLPAGQLIAIIVAVGVGVGLIVGLVVYCLRRNMKKKGNRLEMKSVSVTGRGDKNSRKKKSSNTSKTSEISAPPPPPCPDSFSFNVEPDPPARPGAPPSSGGGAPLVGPDTGKPDKPAELIDINSSMVSEKKGVDSSKKDATVANTVTGTDSKAEPTGKKDATDTTKKDKNGESAKSDTGRNSKVEGTKKKRNKDQKVTLDKNGRGLTDDEDFNIDSGAKPVNHEDKNKKPYAPAVDPRKKMINVTMTEDEDGHVKPKVKNSMF